MLHMTKWFKHTMLASIICITPITSLAATSFLDTDKLFITIEDERDRTEAWGTCIATYKLASMIQAESAPAMSKQLSQLSNGAAIAFYMNYLMGVDSDASTDQLSARIRMGKLLMESIPETQLTGMLARGEQLQRNKEWYTLVTNTLELCLKNHAQQKSLISAWRDLSASGVFE